MAGDSATVASFYRAQEPVSAGSDWLTVIGTRGRTISYPVSCELTSCLASLPQWFPFFFIPPLSRALSLSLVLSPSCSLTLSMRGNNTGLRFAELYLPAVLMGMQYDNVVILNCQEHSLVHSICCHSGGFPCWLRSNRGTHIVCSSGTVVAFEVHEVGRLQKGTEDYSSSDWTGLWCLL